MNSLPGEHRCCALEEAAAQSVGVTLTPRVCKHRYSVGRWGDIIVVLIDDILSYWKSILSYSHPRMSHEWQHWLPTNMQRPWDIVLLLKHCVEALDPFLYIFHSLYIHTSNKVLKIIEFCFIIERMLYYRFITMNEWAMKLTNEELYIGNSIFTNNSFWFKINHKVTKTTWMRWRGDEKVITCSFI